MWVRVPPVLLMRRRRHWRAQVPVKHPRKLCRFDSYPPHCWPVRLSERGRQPLELEGWVRFPYGLLGLAKWWNSRHTALRTPGPVRGVGVQLSPWSLACRHGRCLTGSHKAGVPGSVPGPATDYLRVDQGPAAVHARCSLVRLQNPRLELAGYANRQSDQVESLVNVGSNPTSATARWSRGPKAKTPGPHPGN